MNPNGRPTGPDGRRVSTTVYLDPAQRVELKELSRHTRVPMAEYIRQGVEIVLERAQRKEALRELMEARNHEREQAREL